jgi:PilZ domain
MPEERRTNKRKRLLLEAKWESMSSTHTARVEDLSLGGCFVDTLGRVEPNEAVDLEVQLPSGGWLSLRGKVASYQPGVGFGMSFTSLSKDEVAALEELMSLREKFI